MPKRNRATVQAGRRKSVAERQAAGGRRSSYADKLEARAAEAKVTATDQEDGSVSIGDVRTGVVSGFRPMAASVSADGSGDSVFVPFYTLRPKGSRFDRGVRVWYLIMPGSDVGRGLGGKAYRAWLSEPNEEDLAGVRPPPQQ